MAWRSMGRMRRTRRSIVPSSSVMLGAGTCTAARCDWRLASSTPPCALRKLQRLGKDQRLVAVLARDLKSWVSAPLAACVATVSRSTTARSPSGGRSNTKRACPSPPRKRSPPPALIGIPDRCLGASV